MFRVAILERIVRLGWHDALDVMHSVLLYCDYSLWSEMRDAERMKEESVVCMKIED